MNLVDISNAYNLIVDKLEAWLNVAISMLPNLVLALLVGIIFYVLSKTVRQVVDRLLKKVTNNLTIIHLISSIASMSVAGVGLFMALSIMNLDNTVKTLLAGAGIIGLALGFAFQDIASNFISGVILSIRHPFGVGDIIKTTDFFGTVEKLNLRNTIMRTLQGQIVFIPNKNVFESPVINFTKSGMRRIDLGVGVSYGDDLEKVKDVTINSIKGMKNIMQNKPVELFYEEFGDSSINFTIQFWVVYRNQADYLSAKSEAIMRIKKAYDENDIMIPFPIRTLDFGIKGGEKLDTVINNTGLLSGNNKNQ
jgi:small-conductance mechanosensitive channel